MRACDFEYDGQCLSDFGFTICTFGGASDFDTVSIGSKITFNTVPTHSGKLYMLAGTKYEECITSIFDICKNPSVYQDIRITNDEYRGIVRWLNRRMFLRFRLLDDDERDVCYYDASFNIDKITSNGDLYGLELTMETNSSFGYGEEQTVSLSVADITQKYLVSDLSDEIGYIYPSLVITCLQDGNLTLTNTTEGCSMVIKNCSADEVITVDGATHIITSSLAGHNIYDDYNFEYFRIGNTLDNRENEITVSLQCTIELTYSPIIKDSPD